MATIRWWNPTGDLSEAHRNMDRLFDQFFGYGGSSSPEANAGAPPTYYLPVDILDTDQAYVLTASVPGFSPEQVEVTYDEGVLGIFAKAEPAQAEGRWLRQERPFGSLTRQLQLPQQVEAAGIKAAFDNGVLTVKVPKATRPRPVKIPVGGGSQKQLSK